MLASKCVKRLQHSLRHHFVPKSRTPNQDDVAQLSDFINQSKRLFVLTGAGVSTESGIRDYRSEGVGLYATSKHRPIEYRDFLNRPDRRRRYWARNFAGWPLFSSFEPNVTHKILVDMERYGNLHWLVTQNVDSLHVKAGSKRLTELHGAGARVECLSCKKEYSRDIIQEKLYRKNKYWFDKNVTDKQGPDGDVIIPDEEVEHFQMVDCESCGGILKPKIVFFGDNVPKSIKETCYQKLSESDSLLIIGSSVQVYSSFRFVIAATEQSKPITILNIGETRGDKYADLKIPCKSGEILPRLSLQYRNKIPFTEL